MEKDRHNEVSQEERQQAYAPINQTTDHGCLTVKLRGRTQTPNQSRGCILSYGTRGDTTDFHVPLQRLLEGLVFPSNEGT